MNPEPMIGEEDVRDAIRARMRHKLVKPKPTIAELEAILSDNNAPPIRTNPDGSITTDDHAEDYARAAISAHLAALERAELVVVPAKATPAMIEAAARCWVRENGGMELAPAQMYRAMLAAAPPPQNSDEVKP